MWCFSNDQLEAVLHVIGERYRVEGHPNTTVDLVLRGVRAVLRSPEAVKLRVREHPVDPLPLFDVEELSVEVEELAAAPAVSEEGAP